MRESTKRLRRQSRRHRIVSRTKVQLRPSVDLITPSPSSTDLPRMIIHKKQLNLNEDSSESELRGYEIEELLPATNKNPIWNNDHTQAVERRSVLFKPIDELAEDFLPHSQDPLTRLPSPFDALGSYPGYPDNLPDFRKLKTTGNGEDSQAGPSCKFTCKLQVDPERKPNKREFETLPVPTKRSHGILRKFIYTKLSQEETNRYLEKQRLDFAAKTLDAKDRYETFRDEAVLKGNRYYKEWEDRQKARQDEIWTQYKWDLSVQEYFVQLKEFDEGVIKIRPEPLILIHDSVTGLLRKGTDTPPDKIQLSYYDDDDPGPPPPPEDRPPFVHQQNKDFLWKQRNANPPRMVPGGFLYVYFDVRENGDVFRVEEYEYAAKEYNDCHPAQQTFLSEMKIKTKCSLSPPVLNTPKELPVPPPVQDLDQILLERGWSRGTIDAYLLQEEVNDKLACLLGTGNNCKTEEEDPEVSNIRTGAKAREVNPFVDYNQRVDWFLFFDQVVKDQKWKILKERGLAPTANNLSAIDYRFKDLIEDRLVETQTKTSTEDKESLLVGIKVRGKTKIAICQMLSTNDKESNLKLGIQLLTYARDKGAEMVFFPESFDFISETVEGTIEMSETLDGPIIRRYKELAVQFRLWIFLGGFHEKLEELKGNGDPWLSHTHVVIDPEGKIVSLYRKIHLFDSKVKDYNEASLPIKESSYFKSGKETVVMADSPLGKIGLGIGHDLNFPNFAKSLKSQGVGVLTYPSSIPAKLGKEQWDMLIKTRAVENQVFVIAPAQSGQHNQSRFSYGHSAVVDPRGKIIVSMKQGSGIVTVDIDLELIDRAREEVELDDIDSKEILSSTISTDETGFSIPSSELDEEDFPFGHVRVKYKTIFLESRKSRGFVNKRCVVPGHVLISCRRVARRMRDLSPEEVSDLFILVQQVQMIMERFHGVTSSTVTVQDGKEAGQTVEHVHVHVLPRKVGDFTDNNEIYRDLAAFDIEGKGKRWREEAEMKEECYAIRNHIREHFKEILVSESRVESIRSK